VLRDNFHFHIMVFVYQDKYL